MKAPTKLMILAAFRYALGRRSYVVTDIVFWLKGNWEYLDTEIKKIILREISEAADKKMLGDSIDQEQWISLLNWE